MPNTSATGGPLLPSPPEDPVLGQSFDDFMQQVMVGVTGLPGNLVRPRWQPEMPNMPAAGVNWLAYGVTNVTTDNFPYIGHSSSGVDILYRDEEFDVMCSMFGTQSDFYSRTLRDSFMIQTNLDVLRLAGVAFIECGSIIKAPSLVQEIWLNKNDLTLRFRRRISRTYPVLNLEMGTFILLTDVGVTSVVQP